MKNLRKLWDNLELYICMVLVAVMVVDLIVQVFFRFVLNNPLTFSEELARWLYVWITCFGIGYATQRGLHIEMGFFFDMLPPAGKKYGQVIINLVCMAALLLILPTAIKATIMQNGIISNTMPVKLSVEYIALPIGIVLAVVRSIEASIKILRAPSETKEGI